MANSRRYTIIGGFLVGAAVLLISGILAFGGAQWFSNAREAIIFFDQSVSGLTVGSPVTFRGVQVGVVKNVQIRVDPEEGKARIAAYIQITGDNVALLDGSDVERQLETRELVARGLRAQLFVYSYVTSQLAINLDFKPGTPANIPVDPSQLEAAVIPSVPSEIEQIKDTVAELPWKETLKMINQSMRTLTRLAATLDKQIGTLAPTLNETAQVSQETLVTVQKAVESGNARLDKTLAAFRELAATLEQQVDTRDEQIDRLMTNAVQTSEALSDLTTRINRLTQPGSAMREDIESAVRDLAVAAESFRQFSQTLERDPNALIFGGSRR